MSKKTDSVKVKEGSFLSHLFKGILLFGFSLLILLSLISFSEGSPSSNYFGLLGYSLAWGFQYLLGLASFFIPLFLGKIAFDLVRGKPLENLKLKIAIFVTFTLSLTILLSSLSAFTGLSAWFDRWVYSETGPYGLQYYLGGVPFYHLFQILVPLLGKFGCVAIFSILLALSSILLLQVRLSSLSILPYIKTLLSKIRKKGVQKEMRFIEPEIVEEPLEKEEKNPSLSRQHPFLTQQFPTPKKMEKKEKAEEKSAPLPPRLPPPKEMAGYVLPSPTLLTQVKKHDPSALKNDLKRLAAVLEETLLSFGIEAKVGDIHCGPTITLFEVHPAVGVKVQKIKTLESDIALNMQAKSIRIIAPIPGKAAVGIEVPNLEPHEVGFRELIENYLGGEKKCHIPLLLGKAVNGEDVWADLTKMPHCIIAGATGSGKSVCINTIVMSLLMTARPDEIKLVMVDPKKVELTAYTRLPHMLAPVITEPSEAYGALNWLVKEMERRYEIFRQLGIRNISSFNSRKANRELESSLEIEVPERLPYIVVIVDELADLMMVSSNDIETPIARIAQMARAVGIHMILATQRPSREVITGLIKANFPTRIAFKVSSRVNSQIVIDENGAESLLGNGDMLFMPPGTSVLVRAQGAYIRDDDINQVIDFICAQAPTDYLIPSFQHFRGDEDGGSSSSDAFASEDALYEDAKNLVLETGTASTTFLQRKLKIGYARAASLMDELEKNGIIGPQEGAKPRKIFYPSSKLPQNEQNEDE